MRNSRDEKCISPTRGGPACLDAIDGAGASLRSQAQAAGPSGRQRKLRAHPVDTGDWHHHKKNAQNAQNAQRGSNKSEIMEHAAAEARASPSGCCEKPVRWRIACSPRLQMRSPSSAPATNQGGPKPCQGEQDDPGMPSTSPGQLPLAALEPASAIQLERHKSFRMRTYAKMCLQVLWNPHLQFIGLKVPWNEHLQKTPGGEGGPSCLLRAGGALSLGRLGFQNSTITGDSARAAELPQPAGIGASYLVRRYRAAFWCVAIVSGLLQAWANRFSIDPDGVNYLDVAQAYSRADWRMALNSYWSPLYSWLAGLVLYVFKPSAYWESTLVHLVNFAIFLAALRCFEFFLSALLGSEHAADGLAGTTMRLPEWAGWTLGYTLFLVSSLQMISLSLVKPDLFVTAIVYLAAGLVIRIRGGDLRWTTFAALGAVLGIGYLAKAILFPLAFVFLVVSLFAAGKFRRAVPRALVAVIVFALVSGPFVLAVSRAKGHLTFSDAGWLNYTWYVSGMDRASHWEGEGQVGTPEHPVRKIFEAPPIYEFATPIQGTYPPWYDPAYWCAGMKPRFNLAVQLRAFGRNLQAYVHMLSSQMEFVVGFLALLLFELNPRAFVRQFARAWPVWAPAGVALGLYALVHVEPRFVGGFAVLLWTSLFAGLRLPLSEFSRKLVWCITIAMVAAVGAKVASGAASDLVVSLRAPAHIQWEVAEDLRRKGIRAGDKAAVLGHTDIADYWAHLAGVSIVADMPLQAAPGFWAAAPEVQSHVIDLFAETGAKAIVTNAVASFVPPEGWRRIARTNYYVYLVSKPNRALSGTALKRG